MSGFLKGVKKVFKKIVKSPIFKAVAIAAAVYFTAGIGAAAMGSTFAAGLPGIASVAGSLGITGGALGTAALEGFTALSGVAAVAEGSELTAAAGMLTPGTGLAGEAAAGLASGGVSAGASAGAGAITSAANAAGAATSGIFDTVSKAFGGMSEGAQKMLFKGGAEGLKMLAGGIMQKDQQDWQEQQTQKAIDDRNRREMPYAVPEGVFKGNTSGYKTPGVIKSAMKEDQNG